MQRTLEGMKAVKAFYLYAVWQGKSAYAPWLLAIPIIDLSVRGLFRKEDIPVVTAQQSALCQIYLHYPGFTDVYTDASLQVNSYTPEFVIPTLNYDHKSRLFYSTWSTTAELYAVLLTLRLICSVAFLQNWLVLSDSQAALAYIKHTAFNDSLVYET